MTRRRARSITRRSDVVAAALLFGALAIGGCNRGHKGEVGPAPSGSGEHASVVTSGSATGGATKPASSIAVPGEATAKPIGMGVTEFVFAAKTPECKHQTAEIATYLLRGELAIAARESQVAAVWLVQLPNKPSAQIAFAGYDSEAKQLARGRGIGSSRDDPPRLFATGSGWTVAWFDANGFAFARPTWEAANAAKIEHLTAVGRELSENIGVNATPSGKLVAVAPFGPAHGQLGMFLFAPVEPGGQGVEAIGVTHHATNPVRPAVAADGDGYYIAWHEAGEKLVTSHFDMSRKETESPATLASPSDIKRDRLALAPTKAGALAVWMEGTDIVTRALDKMARPSGPAYRIARGKWASVASTGDGAVVAWVGHDGRADDQLLAVRVGVDGAPASKGMGISDGTNPVKDPPSVTVAEGRIGFGWAEPMGATIISKRAVLRTVLRGCLP